MRLLSQVLVLLAGSAVYASRVDADEVPQIQSFIGYCAYGGSYLNDDHWLGTFCRNNMTKVFGYNFTWCVALDGRFRLQVRKLTATTHGRIDLDHCVGNNGSQLIAYEE